MHRMLARSAEAQFDLLQDLFCNSAAIIVSHRNFCDASNLHLAYCSYRPTHADVYYKQWHTWFVFASCEVQMRLRNGFET